jgi:tRNA(Ile)-lysidine synthetase-like protein
MRALHRLTGAEHEAVLRAAELCEGQKGIREIDGTWKAERGRLGLYLIEKRREMPDNREYPLPQEGSLSMCGMGMLTAEKGSGIPVKDNPFCQELSRQSLCGAVIRTRRQGDMIHPLGAPGRQKLKEYFINHRVGRPLRGIVPLVARGSEVLWVMGEGISEEAKLTASDGAVRLTLSDGILNRLEYRGTIIQRYESGGDNNA